MCRGPVPSQYLLGAAYWHTALVWIAAGKVRVLGKVAGCAYSLKGSRKVKVEGDGDQRGGVVVEQVGTRLIVGLAKFTLSYPL